MENKLGKSEGINTKLLGLTLPLLFIFLLFWKKGFHIFYKKKYMFGAHFCVQLVLEAATLPFKSHLIFYF